jgi:cation:H+ antiporter
VGAAALALGARWFLAYATELTDLLRVDESTWGLTVVALVTTAPEASACLALTLRGDREGAVGVAVGSSLFNLTAALGLAAIRSPEGLEVSPVLFEFALPIAIAAGFACVPSFYGMRHLSRFGGLVLFAFYVAFAVYAIVGENWRQAADPLEAQQGRFFAMFLIAVGLIVVSSIAAILERLAQKARLADE